MPIIQNGTTTPESLSSKIEAVLDCVNKEDSSGHHIITFSDTKQLDQGEIHNVHSTAVSSTAALSLDDSQPSASVAKNATESDLVEDADRRSLRLYSKKHRVYIFREFILNTYSDYLASIVCTGNTTKAETSIILDIAGGKGDLSWILHNIDNYHSIVVDPRCTVNHIDKSVEYLRRFPDECKKRSVPNQSTYQPLAALMPILEQKNYHTESPFHIRIFVDEELVQVLRSIVMDNPPNRDEIWESYWTKATHRTIDHITPSGKNDFSLDRVTVSESSNTITHSQTALQYILQAKLIVGYHPDQATDACFTLAQVLNIPVCVVPCCVFPSEFPYRRVHDSSGIVTSDDDDDENSSVVGTGRPVESYDDLIQYLQQQYPHLETERLDFPGTTTARRIVLYTPPPHQKVTKS
jgi:hypothetical protein